MIYLGILAAMTAGCTGEPESTKQPLDTGDSPGGDSPVESVESDTEAPDSPPDSGEETGDSGGDTAPDAGFSKLLGGENYAGYGADSIHMSTGNVDGAGSAELVAAFAGAGGGADAMLNGGVAILSPPFDTIESLPGVTNSEIDGIGQDQFGIGGVEAAGDVNGDGIADVLVGNPHKIGPYYPGQAYLFYGPMTSNRTSADADAWFTVDCPGYDGYDYHYCELGRDVSTGDINGDGVSDVVISGGEWDSIVTPDLYDLPYRGMVVLGPIYGEVALETDADARFTTLGEFEAVGDLDGDGLCDVVAADIDEKQDGALVFSGPLTGDLGEEDATAALQLPKAASLDGVARQARDLNGDGYLDIVVADGASDSGADAGGSVYITYGPYSGTYDIPTAGFELTGPERSNTGESIVAFEDLDGDGFGDLAIGAPEISYEHRAGSVYIVPGPVRGNMEIGEAASHHLEFGDGEDMFGDEVSDAGDVDGDGIPDLLVVGPGDEDGGDYAGAVWLVYGWSLQ